MRKMLIGLVAMLFFSVVAFGQTTEVTGKVTDSSGVALPNASVTERGTKNGVRSGVDGVFRIKVKPGAKLVISEVGYEQQEVAASGNLNISLFAETRTLSEVVVTALGIRREKKSLAYAVQTVNNDEINKSGTGNPLGELNGKVSGLTVINSAGDPGAGTYIRLRGVTSLTGNNQPLMVIDGVPIDNSINSFDPTGAGFQASGASGNQTGGAQATNRGVDINPNDIESMTVLKGPAATALYGIQAASGAIIITTKKGSSGSGKKLNVSINSSYTADKVNKLPGRQNQYAQGTGIDPNTLDNLSAPVYIGADSKTGDGSTPLGTVGESIASGRRLTWGPAISGLSWTGIANPYDKNGRLVPTTSSLAKYAGFAYNPYDFFKTGGNFNNSIAVSSGTEKTGFRMSFGNLHQTGVVPLSKYDKTTFSVSGQSELTKKLSVSGSILYTNSGNDKTQQGSNISGVMLGLLRTPTTFDNSNGLSDAANNPASYVFADGTQRDFRGTTSYDNPYWTVNRNPFHSDLSRAIGYGQASYQLMDWMTLTYRLGGDVYTQSDKSSYDINSGAFPAGSIYLIDYQNQQFNSNVSLNMHKSFGKDFNATLVVGQDYFSQKSNTRYTAGTGLVLPAFFDISNATSFLASEGSSKIKRNAYYGQGQLDYKQMLFLTLTGRSETSSTLPAANNNFFYPSVSLGWVFTELAALKGNNVLSFGKLRASYAEVGKDAPPQGLQTYFRSASAVDGFTNGLTYPLSSTLPGFQISSTTSVLGNPNLKPESDKSYEVGLDLSFVHNRINLSGTYYYAKATDEIFTVPISYGTGYASVLLNAGVITNHGLELSLNTTPVKLTNGLRWDVNFNWSTNTNKVISLYPGVNSLFIAGFTNGGIYAIPGQSTGVIYGTDFIKTASGQTVIDDVVGDAGYGMPIVGTTSGVVGNATPKWIGSAISNLVYKGFAFGFQIDVRHGGQIWNGTRGAMSYFGTSAETANRNQATVFNGVLGHLDGNGNIVNSVNGAPGAGAVNTIQSSYSQYYWQNIGSSFVGPTSINIEDGSFVRIRQVSLSYDLSKKLLGNAFNNVSVTVFANNPKLWTKYSGVDPETSLGGPSNGQGLDYFNNPGVKSYGVRLTVGL